MFKKTLALLVIGTGLCSFQPSQAEIILRSAFSAINGRVGACIDIASSFTPFLALNKNMNTVEKVCYCSILGGCSVLFKFLPSLPFLKKNLSQQGKLKLLGSFNAVYAGIDLATILLLGNQKISRPTFWSLVASAGWNAVSAGVRFYRAAHVINKEKPEDKLNIEKEDEEDNEKEFETPKEENKEAKVDPKTQEVSEEKKKILEEAHRIFPELRSNIDYYFKNLLRGYCCEEKDLEQKCKEFCQDLNKFFTLFDEKPLIKENKINKPLTDEKEINEITKEAGKIDYDMFKKWAEGKDLETLKAKIQELIKLAAETGQGRRIVD